MATYFPFSYLFIIVLEIVFLFTKDSKKINGLNIFDKMFLYTGYADDNTFFLKDTRSVIELMNILDIFSKFSGLKPNKSKCEIAGMGALKGVQAALCGMRYIDLMFSIVKILRIYNDKLKIQENFKRHIIKIENILQIWRMRELSIAGKITVFKTLALLKTIPNSIIQELSKTQKEFICKTCNPKIKHDTLCKNYENGSLKIIDIMYKVVSLQCSWIKRLYHNNLHIWKVIPLYMITQKLGKKFLLHSNLDVNPKEINCLPQYYQEIFRKWSSNLSVSPNIPSTITSQVFWFNTHIKIDKKYLCNNSLANQGINHVGQLFNENSMAEVWVDIKTQFNLSNKQHYFWIQLINAIEKSLKEELHRSNHISDALSMYDHHLIKKKSNIFFR